MCHQNFLQDANQFPDLYCCCLLQWNGLTCFNTLHPFLTFILFNNIVLLLFLWIIKF